MQYQIPFEPCLNVPFVKHSLIEFFDQEKLNLLRTLDDNRPDEVLNEMILRTHKPKDTHNMFRTMLYSLGYSLGLGADHYVNNEWPVAFDFLDRQKVGIALLNYLRMNISTLVVNELSTDSNKYFGSFEPSGKSSSETIRDLCSDELRVELVYNRLSNPEFEELSFSSPLDLLDYAAHQLKIFVINKLNELEKAQPITKTAKGRYTDKSGLPRIAVKGSEVDPVEIKIRITDDRMIERIAQEKVGSKKSAQEVVALDYEFLYRFWLSKQ